jgi:hypothetical protein
MMQTCHWIDCVESVISDRQTEEEISPVSVPETLLNPERRRALQASAAGAAMTFIAPTMSMAVPPAADQLVGNAPAFAFRIGAFRAVALGDGQATWPAFPTYASNTTEDQLQRSLAQNFMDPVDYTLNFNALYVDTGTHRVPDRYGGWRRTRS